MKIKTLVGVIATIKNTPTYFADYLKLIREKYIIYVLRNGIRFKVRAGTYDRGVLNEIWIHRHYTPKGFEIGDGDVVIDIGGHIGMFSVLASTYAKKGRVYVFEPTSENFKLLNENLQLNGIKNVLAANKAVSDAVGKKELNVSADNTGGHSFYVKEGKTTSIMVETDSLKNIIGRNGIERVNFLKMDCEGAEYEILFGCPRDILEKIEKISLEYHNIDESRNAGKLKEFLEANGFEVGYGSGCSILYAKRK